MDEVSQYTLKFSLDLLKGMTANKKDMVRERERKKGNFFFGIKTEIKGNFYAYHGAGQHAEESSPEIYASSYPV